MPALLDQLDAPLESFAADGAYDRRSVYAAVLRAGPAPKIVVPPRRTARIVVPSEPLFSQRDAAIRAIRQDGRRRWQKTAGYHQQARAENALARFKRTFGPQFRARREDAQNLEAMVACKVLNGMSLLGQPDSAAVVAG